MSVLSGPEQKEVSTLDKRTDRLDAKPQIDEDSCVIALAHDQTRDVLWCARHLRGLNFTS